MPITRTLKLVFFLGAIIFFSQMWVLGVYVLFTNYINNGLVSLFLTTIFSFLLSVLVGYLLLTIIYREIMKMVKHYEEMVALKKSRDMVLK